MILNLFIIHNHDRMSSITRVLYTTTWDYFSSLLPESFGRSPQVVKEAIIKDIDDLVEEFRRISSDVGASFFAMRRLLDILQDILDVCFDIIPFLRLAEKIYRCSETPMTGTIPYSRTMESEPKLRCCLMGIERCSITQFVNPKIWVTSSDSYLVSQCRSI